MNLRIPHVAALALIAVLALSACDASITGEPAGNLAPDTELAVQVTDLRETLGDGTLVSTVEVNWSGTDPDGYVASYELRFFDADRLGQIGPEEGWIATTRRDTTITLPIPPGNEQAAVAFEVRAVDNEGAKDADPARTVFPIRNSPPSIQLSGIEVPPDTTWPAASFSWTASDPDGEANLLGVEIALNDSLGSFLRLPADVDFVTLVAEDPRADETTARVLLGVEGTNTGLTLPNFRPGQGNTLYLRAVDAAEFTSRLVQYPDEDAGQIWFVQQVTGDVLLVNDYRTEKYTVIMPFHRALLDSYGASYDEWYLSEPFQTGATIISLNSENLPRRPEPTLRETFRFWDYIYWVSNTATDRTASNDLPFVASVLTDYTANGGRVFINVPVRLPTSPEDNNGNQALALLPLSGLLSFGAGSEYPEYQSTLELPPNADLTPVQPLPNGVSLPPLEMARPIQNAFSYPVQSGVLSLYQGMFRAKLLDGTLVPWDGPSTIVSMRSDARVALFALPFVTELSGSAVLRGQDGDPDAPQEAVRRILASMGFPQ